MRVFVVATLVCVVLVTERPAGVAAAPPPGYSDTLVATIGAPTALAFTPDGRILVTTQGGAVRVISPQGQLDPTPAMTFPAEMICTNSERGLLGIAVDPQFGQNGYVFLYYTFRKGAGCPQNGENTPVTNAYPVNRVSRFVLSANTISLASETVILDNIPSPNGNHNAGDLRFGPDGNLYVSVGDGGCDYAGGSCQSDNDAARDTHVALGKILRVDRNGNIPAGNPYMGEGSGRCNLNGMTSPGLHCRETWARGFRNPFRIAFDSFGGSSILYANDVGGGSWEEVNVVTSTGDYGWNVREGHCATGSTTNCGPPPVGMTNPILDYRHETVPGGTGTCDTITGGAVVPPGVFSGMDRAYLFADFGCGVIFAKPSGSASFSVWASGFGTGSITAMAFGPRGTETGLYYLTYSNGGQLRVITADHPPTDANCDGSTTAADALAVLRAMAGIASPPLPVAPCTGDADGNGNLAPADVRLILAAIAD